MFAVIGSNIVSFLSQSCSCLIHRRLTTTIYQPRFDSLIFLSSLQNDTVLLQTDKFSISNIYEMVSICTLREREKDIMRHQRYIWILYPWNALICAELKVETEDYKWRIVQNSKDWMCTVLHQPITWLQLRATKRCSHRGRCWSATTGQFRKLIAVRALDPVRIEILRWKRSSDSGIATNGYTGTRQSCDCLLA